MSDLQEQQARSKYRSQDLVNGYLEYKHWWLMDVKVHTDNTFKLPINDKKLSQIISSTALSLRLFKFKKKDGFASFSGNKFIINSIKKQLVYWRYTLLLSLIIIAGFRQE